MRLPSGQRCYRTSDLRPYLGASPDRRACVYARVSTRKQADAGNLERQRRRLLEQAATAGYPVVLQAEDVASGLNPKRRGRRKVIQAAQEPAMVTSFPARLYGARGGRKVRAGWAAVLEEVEESVQPQEAQAAT